MRGTGGHDNNDGNPRVYLDEKQRYKLLREMLLALDLVHKSGMIHLDIKPENIFIKNGQYKLGDFGLVSTIESHDDVEEGDSRYMSMELLSGELDDLTKVSKFGWR
jgi:serine/threonine protein kinase